MHSLASAFLSKISSGLHRSSITSASAWATTYREMKNGLWSFKYHPWLKGMHDSEYQVNIGQKAAQMGFTETVLNITFYNIDIHAKDCMYVLPNRTPDASDFSASRFDPALELSPHLTNLFSNVKNVGHKRAGAANLYVRGSRSRAGLKSNPVALMVLDEIEEFHEGAISLALERTSGQLGDTWVWMISTPSVEDEGINTQFKASTQDHFFFKCPSCRRHIELDFPQNLVITSDDPTHPKIKDTFIKCHKCEAKLPHQLKHEWLADATWQPSYTNKLNKGWFINQLYSSAVEPWEFAQLYLKGLDDPADEQEFFNSKCGKPHEVKGARLSETDIRSCHASHTNGNIEDMHGSRIITMGTDVGTWLHCEIAEWIFPQSPKTGNVNMEAKPKVLEITKVKDFEDLDSLMMKYRIDFCIIDANPERRKAIEFANRFDGHVLLCFYTRGIKGKQIRVNEEDKEISVDRTSWLDLSLGRFRKKDIWIPQNAPREYVVQLRAPVKRYEKDADGQTVAKYVEGSKEDHYAHARNYNEIALPFAASFAANTNITVEP